MAIASGVGGYFSVAAESTYGTYVAPDHHMQVDSAQLKKNKNTQLAGGVAAGMLVDRGSRRVVTTSDAGGSVKMEVGSKNFGLLLAHGMGSSATPVQQSSTAAYLQTHALGDNIGKYLSAQVGLPDLGGTIRPYSFLGCKVSSMEFSCAVDQFLQASIDFDSQQLTEAQTAVSPSYTLGNPFHFGQATVAIGTFGSEATVQGVRKFDVKINRPLRNDRFYFGNSGVKKEPVSNGKVAITGSLDVDFVTKGDFADRFSTDTPFSLKITFTGANIASSFYETFSITLPACYLDGDTPTLDGPDIISGTFPFTALYDGTNNACTIGYMSTDIAV